MVVNPTRWKSANEKLCWVVMPVPEAVTLNVRNLRNHFNKRKISFEPVKKTWGRNWTPKSKLKTKLSIRTSSHSTKETSSISLPITVKSLLTLNKLKKISRVSRKRKTYILIGKSRLNFQ
eukprot:PhF_6_TR15913/c0_g1_i1/m.24584